MNTGDNAHLLDRQDGTILVAILVIMTLSGIVIGASLGTLIEIEIAGDFANQNAAFVVAESGMMHAFAVLEDVNEVRANGFTEELCGKDGKPDTTDDSYFFGVDYDKKTKQLLPEFEELGKGRYFIRIVDNQDGDDDPLLDSDAIVTVISTGVWGTEAVTVVADVGSDAAKYDFEGAIIDGDLRMTGKNNIVGGNTRLHANGDINAKVEVLDGGATATGSLDLSGDPLVEGQKLSKDELKEYEEAHSGAEAIEVEDIDVDDYEDLVDYELTGSGRVKDAEGDEIHDADDDGPWGAWKYKNGEWAVDSDLADYEPMTLLIDSDLKINGKSGPAELALLITGDLEVTTDLTLLGDGHDITLVVEGSLKANSNTELHGSVLINDEVSLTSETTIYGTLVVNDENERGSKITGQFTLSTPEGMGVKVGKRSDGVTVLNWHVRSPNRH